MLIDFCMLGHMLVNGFLSDYHAPGVEAKSSKWSNPQPCQFRSRINQAILNGLPAVEILIDQYRLATIDN